MMAGWVGLKFGNVVYSQIVMEFERAFVIMLIAWISFDKDSLPAIGTCIEALARP